MVSGKKIRLVLKNNFHYSGVVLKEDEKSITILDKFSKEVMISKDSISIWETVEE